MIILFFKLLAALAFGFIYLMQYTPLGWIVLFLAFVAAFKAPLSRD